MRSYDKHRGTKLKQSDVGNGILVTIADITEENCAGENKPEDIKFVLYFKEDYKPWAPCFESLEVIKQISGYENVDDWPGTRLVLYVDPTVKFGPKTVGGIRCRAPKQQAETQQQAKPQVEDEGVPF